MSPLAIAASTETKEEILRLVTVEEFLASHPKKAPWVLKPFATEASVGMLFGHQGRGKSSILLQLAHSVASGEPWMGFQVEKCGPVILLETDMDQREMRFLLGRAHEAGMSLDGVFVPEIQPDFNILNVADYTALREWCDEIEPALVILDTADAGYYAAKEDNPLIKKVLTLYPPHKASVGADGNDGIPHDFYVNWPDTHAAGWKGTGPIVDECPECGSNKPPAWDVCGDCRLKQQAAQREGAT